MAMYDYLGAEGELSFSKGDTILLTEQVNIDTLKGHLGEKSGTFPKGFVVIIKDLPGTDRYLCSCLLYSHERSSN